MLKFIKGVLSESDGTPSSRRVVMFILTLLFVAVVIFNALTGKVIDATLKDQLFYLLLWIFGVVMADKVVTSFKASATGEKGGDRPNVPPPNP